MKRRFRIGSTSYVYPDDILPNARQLAGIVDDIELVLFEVDAYGTNLPNPFVVTELNALSRAHDLSYTVHLPLDLRFGDAVSFDKARRAVDATRDLNPFAWVTHLDGRDLRAKPTAETITEWQRDSARALAQMVQWTGDGARICVENLEAWDSDYFRPVVAGVGVSRCVDIGHLWLQNGDPVAHLEANLPRTRVIHLHGIGSRDHQSLQHVPAQQLRRVLETIVRADYAGVLTLEVFGEEDFFSSLDVLRGMLDELGVEWARTA